MDDKNCGNCKWWADNEVCVNGDSDQVADFTDKDFQCDCHEFRGGGAYNEIVSQEKEQDVQNDIR